MYDALGSSDWAIAVYERYVGARSLSRTTLDAFELGHALERLGALYDKRGDRARAGEYYARWADLWRGADPSLRRRDVGGASSRTLGRTGESVASSRRLIGDASSARRL